MGIRYILGVFRDLRTRGNHRRLETHSWFLALLAVQWAGAMEREAQQLQAGPGQLNPPTRLHHRRGSAARTGLLVIGRHTRRPPCPRGIDGLVVSRIRTTAAACGCVACHPLPLALVTFPVTSCSKVEPSLLSINLLKKVREAMGQGE